MTVDDEELCSRLADQFCHLLMFHNTATSRNTLSSMNTALIDQPFAVTSQDQNRKKSCEGQFWVRNRYDYVISF